MVSYEEFRHSAASLTVSVGRNDYNGYKLFCNGFFHEWHYLSHPRASVARPGDLLDCRVKPDNDNYLFVIPRFSSFPRHIWAFLPLSHPRNALRLSGDDNENTRHLLTICTQKATRFNKGSRRSRCCGQAGYSLRASTKIRTTAGVAVKLATACKTTKKTRCFFTKAAAFSRLTKFIRLSDRSEPEFDASVHSRAVVRG